MLTSALTAESLLAVDVGAVHTRAVLFDVVEGQYRFIAVGLAKSTIGAPYANIGEGVRRAISHLETILGRTFLSESRSLIIPSTQNGAGIDTFALTISGGDPLRVVSVGLLDDVSAKSAKRLAETIYSNIVDVVTLNGYRSLEKRIDAIIKARPDLVIIAGGTNGGARSSVMKMVEAVGLACYLLPANIRPEVLYAGNESIKKEVHESLSSLVHLETTENIRPLPDVEQLQPAQAKMVGIYRRNRNQKLMGASEFDIWAGRKMLPTAMAFHRIIGFLGKSYDASRGVLGVDVGASSVTLSLSYAEQRLLGVYSDLGLGENIVNVLDYTTPEDIAKWIPNKVSPESVEEYIYNKAVNPITIPGTQEALLLEQAIAREIMRIAATRLRQRMQEKKIISNELLLPWVEPIIASGSVLTHTANPGQSLLMILDGLQPGGITNIVLDQNSITPALGAAAEINPMLVVQVLESKAFQSLGTVISPVGVTKYGKPCLRVWLTQEDGTERSMDVPFGTIQVIPTPVGKKVNLRLLPLQRFDVGMGGIGRGGKLRGVGGILGIIIDARGRPLNLPDDPVQRLELQKKWRQALGAS